MAALLAGEEKMRINLLNTGRNASLRYRQAKTILRRAGIYRYYNPLRTGRSLKIPLAGSAGGKTHVFGLGLASAFPEHGTLRALARLADRTSRTTVWGGSMLTQSTGGMPRFVKRGPAGRAVSFAFRTRGLRGRGKYGGSGAFAGQGRGWRRLLKSLREKN